MKGLPYIFVRMFEADEEQKEIKSMEGKMQRCRVAASDD